MSVMLDCVVVWACSTPTQAVVTMRARIRRRNAVAAEPTSVGSPDDVEEAGECRAVNSGEEKETAFPVGTASVRAPGRPPA